MSVCSRRVLARSLAMVATSLARATEAAEPGKHPLVNDLIADFSTLSSELQASRDAELAELHAAQATRTVQRSLFS